MPFSLEAKPMSCPIVSDSAVPVPVTDDFPHRLDPPSKPGLYGAIAEADYHAWDAVSYSGVKVAFHGGPAAWAHRRRYPMRQTEAMLEGSVLHARLSGVLDRYFVVEPEWEFGARSNAGKEERASWAETHARDRQMVTACLARRADLAARLVESMPAYRIAREGGVAEVSAFWFDEATGLGCKCRGDHYYAGGDRVLDVKKMADFPTDHAIEKAVGTFDYHIQAAAYQAGFEAASGHRPSEFEFLFVQLPGKNETPGEYFLRGPARLVILDDAAVRQGAQEWHGTLNQINSWRTESAFPNPSHLPRAILGLPRWRANGG